MRETPDISLLLTLLNGMDYSMYIIDKKGDTLFYNNATLQLYRCSREVFEKEYKNMYHMEKRGTFQRNLFYEVMEKKQTAEGWLSLTDVHGGSRLYYVVDSPVFDSEGNVKYVVGTTRSREKIEREHLASQTGLSNLLQGFLAESGESQQFIYQSPSMRTLVNMLSRVAPTDVPIMLQGESGTGKEVLATYIHANSRCRDQAMVSINCAAISPNLFEAEMFGYGKNAFTGSNPKGKVGLIEKANHSTLFLDEIDSMPLEQQGKLLRALEERKIYRLGENEPITVNFRLISATNKNMQQAVQEGRFRQDLYYRLNVVPAVIPPLRDRKEDIRPLTDYYLSRFCSRYSLRKRFSENVYRQLEAYQWPGNVRELRNLVERTVLMSDMEAEEIKRINLPDRAQETSAVRMPPAAAEPAAQPEEPPETSLDNRVEAFERALLQEALERYSSYSEAAKHLGISISTMSRKANKYGLSREL